MSNYQGDFQRIEKKYILDEEKYNALMKKLDKVKIIKLIALILVVVFCLTLVIVINKKITITDSDSNTVLEYTPSKTYSSIVIATSEFQKGKTYNLNIDGSNYSSFTISSIVNNVGNTSNNFGPGNMKNGPFNGRQR